MLSVKFESLVECKDEFFYPGTIFKFKASFPYENEVAFMLFNPNEEDSGLGVIVL